MINWGLLRSLTALAHVLLLLLLALADPDLGKLTEIGEIQSFVSCWKAKSCAQLGFIETPLNWSYVNYEEITSEFYEQIVLLYS